MSELIIHVIPEAYWGGKGPKVARGKEARATPGMASSAGGARRLSARTQFWILVSGTFLIVVAVAAWYFTKPLRVQPLRPASPPVEVPAAPSAPPTVPDEPLLGSVEPEATPAPEAEPIVEPPPSDIEDVDRDGLSGIEETLYHSEPTQPDTDKDGFLDGHEVVNLYNPSGIAPQRLEAAGLAQRFVNQEGGYELLIPIGWKAQISVGSTTVLILDREEQTVFKVDINENPQEVSLEQWYANDSEAGQAQATVWTGNKAGLPGILAENRMVGYFSRGNQVFSLEYISGSGPGPYQTTFEMMLNSFRIMN